MHLYGTDRRPERKRAPYMRDVLLLLGRGFCFRRVRGTGVGKVEVLGKATEEAPGVGTHRSLRALLKLGVGRSRASLSGRGRFLGTEYNRVGSGRRFVLLHDGRLGLTSRGIRNGSCRGLLLLTGELRSLAGIVTLSCRLSLLFQLGRVS
jgi:hypothetical protein